MSSITWSSYTKPESRVENKMPPQRLPGSGSGIANSAWLTRLRPLRPLTWGRVHRGQEEVAWLGPLAGSLQVRRPGQSFARKGRPGLARFDPPAARVPGRRERGGGGEIRRPGPL
ncbi:unnamed protein product [Rangifer tarandus platyrhynchus]|uniref:Uncharacterized protein n=1 Tax=Rangifer tarandus platyrhynchus TaxID=3082113 RepID=A0AC59Z6E5_RANTA